MLQAWKNCWISNPVAGDLRRWDANVTFTVTCVALSSVRGRPHLGAVIWIFHWSDVIMGAMASQITSLTIVYSTVYSCADQRKHQNASLAFLRGIHQWPVNSPHKEPVTWKMFPFDDVIMFEDFDEEIGDSYKIALRNRDVMLLALPKIVPPHRL